MVSLKSLATGTQGVSLVCVSLRCVLRRAPFVPMMQAGARRLIRNARPKCFLTRVRSTLTADAAPNRGARTTRTTHLTHVL